MAYAIGRRTAVMLSKESSRGTPATGGIWIPQTEVSFQSRADMVKSEETLGSISESGSQFVTKKYAEGELSGEVRDQSFGYLLYAALGTLSTSGPVDSAYTHAFSLAETNAHQTLSILIQAPEQANDILYASSMLESLTINLAPDSVAKFTASFRSFSEKDWTNQTVSYTSAENKFITRHTRLKLAANIAGLGAASVIPFRSLKLEIKKNLTDVDTGGTVQANDIINQAFSVSGSIELDNQGEAYKDYMLANTYRSMQIILLDTDDTIGASTNPSLTINMPRVGFEGWEIARPNNEVVTETINFFAYQDLANALKPISTCSLINAKTSY